MNRETGNAVRWALVTVATGFTATTIGHYAEFWIAGYVVTLFLAIFGAVGIAAQEQ